VPSSSGPGWQALSAPRRAPTDERHRFTPSAFARLARVHALSAAADTLVATSLAGTLFFSIPTGEARGRVALYLLLTIAPFALIGPLMGPALDRMPGGRRLLVLGTGAGRVITCLFMARNVDSLLLFPAAFVILVLGKAYAIARSALVPTVVDSDDDLVDANSRLSLLGGVSGFVAAVPGAIVLKLAGAEWVLLLAAVCGLAQAILASRLPRTQVAAEPPGEAESAELRGATVVHAAEAMGLLRGIVGFLTFLLAFALRGGGDDTPIPMGLALGRAIRSVAGFPTAAASGGGGGSPTWHFGVVIAASVLGGLIGAVVAPRLRASMTEERILEGALVATIVGGLVAALIGGLLGATLIAGTVGVAASSGKLAFDAIVQRDAPDANRGRSFAAFETRFQLIWVIGGFIPVVVPLPARIGFLVVAGAAAFALFGLLSTRRRRPFQPQSGAAAPTIGK
jgi:hypothetical protein